MNDFEVTESQQGASAELANRAFVTNLDISNRVNSNLIDAGSTRRANRQELIFVLSYPILRTDNELNEIESVESCRGTSRDVMAPIVACPYRSNRLDSI
jgi:hypothetical protein